MQWSDEQEMFRSSVREFVQREIDPFADEWEAAGTFPAHDLFARLGRAGFLGLEYDPAYGGGGADHWYTLLFGIEMGRAALGAVPMAVSAHTDMATPSLHRHGSEALKERFLRPAIAGEQVASIAVTEPDAGSDVASLRTRAVADGDEWVVNGTKLYITTGTQSDWLCLLARTSDEGGYRGMSQIVVPRDTPGVSVSRKLDKLGNRASDTAELSFQDVRVPVDHTIGEAGQGFQQQMEQFQKERLIAVYNAIGAMEEALRRTREWLAERTLFGSPLASKQYVQFTMAELSADLDLVVEYAYGAARALVAGEDVTRRATVAKLAAGRLSRRLADTCLQFHGGLGYMEETWTSRYFRDSRLLSIGGGADEVMLQVLAKMDGWSG